MTNTLHDNTETSKHNTVTKYSFTVFEESTEPLQLKLNCNLTFSKEAMRLIILKQFLHAFMGFNTKKTQLSSADTFL